MHTGWSHNEDIAERCTVNAEAAIHVFILEYDEQERQKAEKAA